MRNEGVFRHVSAGAGLLQADKQSACCGVHSLAELYSTVTRMPGRINGDQAMVLVAEIRERLSIIALDTGEYVCKLEKSAALGISGGSIYDALLAACAIKANAETIYSWNMRHYSMLGPEVEARLRRP